MRTAAGVAFVAVAVTAAVASAAGAAQPRLRLVDRQPLVVRGDGFRPGEQITLVAATGLGPRMIRTTSRNGSFRATFRLADQPCAAAFAVRARGDRGSVAILRMAESRPCVPPPRD
jgi:hypothetical protein